jgi:uracil-DNA glycosylase
MRACHQLEKEGMNNNLVHYITDKKVSPFIGRNAKGKVLLVGQDPTIQAKKEIRTVLELDKSNSNLYRFITQDILTPLNLTIDEVYATNIINHFFIKTPKQIAEEIGMSLSSFVNYFAEYCFGEFSKEITGITPKVIITLGEPVYEFFNYKFELGLDKIKNTFATLIKAHILDRNVNLIPCVHYNTANLQKHYSNQSEKLKQINLIIQ